MSEQQELLKTPIRELSPEDLARAIEFLDNPVKVLYKCPKCNHIIEARARGIVYVICSICQTNMRICRNG